MVIGVQHGLVVHCRVDGGDRAAVYAHRLVQGPDHRHDGVGGAGRGGHDTVVALQGLVVYPVDHRGIHVGLSGLGKKYAPGALPQVLFRGGPIGERAAAFQHDIDTEFAPGQIADIGLAQQGDGIAIDPQLPVIALQGAGKAPMGGVVAGQVQHGAGIR